MADNTKIEWADATANAVNGCSVISPGCTNCYAMKQAHRPEMRRGLTTKTKGGMVWTGEVRFSEKQLLLPLGWSRPRRIFWNAHGDLFHENVPDEWIDRVFAIAALTPQHQHLILTKRSDRMRAYITSRSSGGTSAIIAATALDNANWLPRDLAVKCEPQFQNVWPLPNVWLGVSVEDQARADQRIPDLLATPAAIRWLSCEPLLGPVNLYGTSDDRKQIWNWLSGETGTMHFDGPDFDYGPRIDWVVVGGESGSGARPMHPDWARSLRDQCQAAGVPFFFKQWGEWYPAFVNDSAIDATGVRETRKIDAAVVHRVGKKRAGRLLDGREWSEWPR